MATPRDIRRLAFQALYQLDARADEAAERVLESIAFDDDDDSGKYTLGERKKAVLLATGAFADRAKADAFMQNIAPDWPVHRQAAVDRAILRLAFYEMMATPTHPKIVVNEAVELAKVFSTDKSPSFINGLLDKALKVALSQRGEELEGPVAGDAVAADSVAVESVLTDPASTQAAAVPDEPAAPGV